MRAWRYFNRKMMERKGAVLVLVALLTAALFGVGALAVDVGHLAMVRNELQNAADAGALAGAANLYNSSGTAINTGANQTALDFATSNAAMSTSGQIPVNINDPLSNQGDIQRGHWSFTSRTFTPSDSLVPIELFGKTSEDLDLMDGSDGNPPFINAVRVVTRRIKPTGMEADDSGNVKAPANSWLARIFGRKDFELEAEAVAYIGFAGNVEPGTVDQPIAICRESILEYVDGKPVFSCNIGRMINSSGSASTSNTGGWTSFEQAGNVCSGTNNSTVKPLVCGQTEAPGIIFGAPIATTGGELQSSFDKMRDCWWPPGDPPPEEPWEMVLPVVMCDPDGDGFHNVGNCPEVTGIVVVNMIWMTEAGTAKPEDAPTKMNHPMDAARNWDFTDTGQCTVFKTQINKSTETALPLLPEGFQDTGRWQGESTYVEGMARWDCFVDHFELKNADDAMAPFVKKSMYFLPDCKAHEPTGGSGGENYGILAKNPVLVD